MRRLKSYREKVREELNRALREDHTPRETALSAALGAFVTTLPTLGLGVLFFLVLAKIFDSINKLALFACVVVFNPAMKYPIYILSYKVGGFLVHSSPPEETIEVAMTTKAAEATQTMLIGNLFLAFVFSISAYFLVLKAARTYEEKDLHLREELVEKM